MLRHMQKKGGGLAEGDRQEVEEGRGGRVKEGRGWVGTSCDGM